MHLRSLLALVALPLIVGCSGSSGPPEPSSAASSKDDPGAAAQTFLDAVRSGDEAALKASLTPGAAKLLDEGGQLSFSGERLESFVVGTSRVEDTAAEVEVSAMVAGEPQELVLLLTRGEQWGVSGLRATLGGGEFEIDFERVDEQLSGLGEAFAEELGQGLQQAFADAQATWEQGGTLEEIAEQRAAFEALTAVTKTEHDQTWQVDVEGAGRSARAVLVELLEPVGLELNPAGQAAALDSTLELKLERVSRVEAVERIAENLGLHPVWPAANPHGWAGDDEHQPAALAFGVGPRPLPVAFSGPFLIEASQVVEHTPQPTGELTLAVRALGLAPPVLTLAADMSEMLSIERVRAADGRALVDESMSYLSSPDIRAQYLVFELERDLTGLLRAVESIATVSGTIYVSIPETIEAVALDAAHSEPIALDAGQLTVVEWGDSTRFELEGDDVENQRLIASPLRADASPLGVRFSSSDAWGSRLQSSLQCPEAPASIDLKLCTLHKFEYRFELPPIPLREFGLRPETLAALSFEGSAPITVSARGPLRFANGMAELDLRVTNTSNKDVVSSMVEFTYLDGGGQALEDFPHTLTGEYDFDLGGARPLATVGAAVDISTHAAFAPSQTATIRFRVQRVELADGTLWEPDSPSAR